jgi:MYXO-CTERM domain-containing protein
VTSPTSFGVRVPGFVSSVADPNGFFDEHPGYELNAPANDGIYLLTLVVENRDGSDVLGRSLPIHFVFGNNAPESEIELAEDFVNDNISSLPTPGGVAMALLGAGALTRRRRA